MFMETREMKRIVFALLFTMIFSSCATLKTECVKPSSEFIKIEIEDVGNASRLENVARKNYKTHKEWKQYAECLAR